MYPQQLNASAHMLLLLAMTQNENSEQAQNRKVSNVIAMIQSKMKLKIVVNKGNHLPILFQNVQ